MVLFLLDRSGSMEAPFADGLTRAAYLARVVDTAIQELAVRCNKADGLRDYFHPHLRAAASAAGFSPGEAARFFAYGAGADLAVRFLNLGTRPGKLA